ncbi:DUF4890 domain-containing protein [Pontibacter harenae]|uniref:DUF4890 domain-containing protein n=1 Tax=Pontibacter harenae TaxID=2894083 RepID=UPI001E5ECC8F|nr:DUF4890 domain-containing protein [Pontibacter harenae]MCC9168295.1 DUF4890 domain-containing protein [Pontibacter harenae]
MKKVIVMLALGVMVAGSSFAQNAPQKEIKARTEQRADKGARKYKSKDKKSPEERAQLKTDRLSQKLELNKSQTKKLQALNLKHEKEMEAMRGKRSNASDRGQIRSEMQTRRAKWNDELKDILTKKQYAKYEADQKEMRARMESRRDHQGKDFKGRSAQRPQRS